MKEKYWLILIIIIAFFLRGFDIGNNPPAMYGDEVTMVYDTYSILKTGRDQYGNFLPLSFATGDGRPAGYVYFSIPFVALFGPTELGIRSLSVLSGVGVVLLMYYLGGLLVSKKIGLIASAITAVSPWGISISRGGFESNFALFLGLLGLYLFLNYQKKPWLLILAAVSFALAMHTYPTYKLTIPLFALPVVWYVGGIKGLFTKKYFAYSAIALSILVLAASVILFQSFSRGSKDRFLSNYVFSQQDLYKNIVRQIDYDRNNDMLPSILPIVFHNKAIAYTVLLGESYIKNFSLDFLFLHGDKNPRHNMGTLGQLYVVEFLTVVFGFWFLLKHFRENNISRKSLFLFSISWLSIAPIATAFLLDVHALRSSFMLPPLILVSALGFYAIWQQNRYMKIIILVGFLIQFIFFLERMYFVSPNEFSRFWAYPAKQASLIAIQNKDKYDYIILTNRIDNVEFAYQAYGKVDPANVIAQNKQQAYLGEYRFKKLDGNIYIGALPMTTAEAFVKTLKGSVLYFDSVDETKYIDKYDLVFNKDTEPSFMMKAYQNK